MPGATKYRSLLSAAAAVAEEQSRAERRTLRELLLAGYSDKELRAELARRRTGGARGPRIPAGRDEHIRASVAVARGFGLKAGDANLKVGELLNVSVKTVERAISSGKRKT